MSKFYNEQGKYEGETEKTDADVWLRCFTALLDNTSIPYNASKADEALKEYKKRWGKSNEQA